MPAQHVAVGLGDGQRLAVDEQRLRVGLLQVEHAQHHRLDLGLDVVGLVDRQPRQAVAELEEDQEQLERVDRADDQVVVGVLAVVEVEAAEPALGSQDGDDLLDVRAVQVVAEVDQHLRALAELQAGQQRRAPVGEVGRVEGGLERLVLEQQLLLVGQSPRTPRQAVEHPLAPRHEVVLARVVGAVGEPQRLRGRAERVRDLHALEQVVGRLAAHAGIGVRDRAELVVRVLEEVRVDRADPQPARTRRARAGRRGRRPRPTGSAGRPPPRSR